MQIFVIAQGLAEYGALASKSGGGSASASGVVDTLRYRLESYIGQGNAPWFVGALVVLFLLAVVFRRRWSA